jgi:hypothetical protein
MKSRPSAAGSPVTAEEVRGEFVEQFGLVFARLRVLEQAMKVRRSAPVDWICLKDAAARADVCTQTCANWIAAGLVAGDLCRGGYRVSPLSLERHIALRAKTQ